MFTYMRNPIEKGDELYKRIMVMPSVKNAVTYMNDSNITKADLVILCKRYNVIIEIKVNHTPYQVKLDSGGV